MSMFAHEMFLGELVRDCVAGKLCIECTSMSLTQDTEHNPSVFRGPGQIVQRENGSLAFTLYSTDTENYRPFGSEPSPSPGRLIDKAHYFTLWARDSSGDKWTGTHILPEPTFTVGASEIVVKGSLWRIVSNQESGLAAPQPTLRAVFVGGHHLPFNRSTRRTLKWAGRTRSHKCSLDHARFRRLNCKFTLARDFDDAALVVAVESNRDDLPSSLSDRIVDALEYMTAQFVRHRVLVTCEEQQRKVEFTSVIAPPVRPISLPPLDRMHSRGSSKEFWSIFANYLHFCHKCVETKRSSPAQEIRGILQGSCGSIETHALTLAVGVEALVSQLYPDAGKPDPATLEALTMLRSYLKKWTGNSQVKNRAIGSISQLSSVRAGDRFLNLVGNGVISQKQYAAWKSLRPAFAHGDRQREEPSQQTIDLIHTVTTMLHRLILHRIKYKGTYTDYSAEGWPLAKLGES